ncbi:MAG: GntR family transcriptional regulator [Granulosicoccus sp.]|nr:GntR family transcriptional regulator [Granulosicoccus sp.]
MQQYDVKDGSERFHASESRKPGKQAIFWQLRADIVDGTYEPNTRLKFAELTKRYAASVGTLREALSELVSDGFVTVETNKGFAVAPVSCEELVEVS